MLRSSALKALALGLLALVLLFAGAVLGYSYRDSRIVSQYHAQPSDNMTVLEAVAFLEYAEDTHTNLANHPEVCGIVLSVNGTSYRPNMGSVEDNLRWAEIYRKIIILLKTQCEELK